MFKRTPLYILNQRKNLGSFVAKVNELRSARQKERDSIVYGNWTETDKILLDKKIKDAKEMEFWRKARMLILTEYNYYGRGIQTTTLSDCWGDFSDQCNTIQACLEIDDCPLSLIEYALLVYSEELLVRNNDGDLPLHKICASVSETKERRFVLMEVLATKPEAAKMPDRNGRSALEIFIQHTSPTFWSEILHRLIVAYPVALDSLDIDPRLYPLIMERIGCNKETRNEIFELLRGVPSLFSR